jgi:hypothetical protein
MKRHDADTRPSDLWVHVGAPHPNEIAHAVAAERLARWLETSEK